MPGLLRTPRRAALCVIAGIVAVASLVSFAESYRGLYVWSHEHGLHGAWSLIWPLQVDLFIAVGELALFVAMVDRWSMRARAGAWAVTGIGLAVSVAGNVGHVTGGFAARATAAVPPLAAAAALAVGLGVLKRVVEAHHATAPAVAPVAVPVATQVPPAPVLPPHVPVAAVAAAETTPQRQPVRQTVRQKPRQTAAKPGTGWRDKAARLVAADPAITAQELAAQCGVSKRSAERYKETAVRPHLVREEATS